MLAEGWLDRLLAGEGARNGGFTLGGNNNPPDFAASTSADFMASNAVVPHRDNVPFSPMTPGFSSGMMPPPSMFSQFGTAPAVDPAQFVWAVSSRLPTVEEASPQDEQRSVSSDPSPANQDPVQRAARRVARELRDEGKIVKVSWWRPHGVSRVSHYRRR